jgi:hypothetical protein
VVVVVVLAFFQATIFVLVASFATSCNEALFLSAYCIVPASLLRTAWSPSPSPVLLSVAAKALLAVLIAWFFALLQGEHQFFSLRRCLGGNAEVQ